ncbi:MAG: phosphate ABC transporter permease PstA [Ignavibacteria bacterium]|jgi:phosphate transport system permease protein|nr:phosphate ABC transporter permease PstA [Ignavibacteria bacterium]MCU7504210.1 phosphate ABC transporter permease PstA [Ignavibacteria bacterium]MCU7516055.1 phosphate ABC transporter permease PstA [Ignavibacteria bacterium]
MRINPRHTQKGAVIILGGATILVLLILAFIIIFILEKGLPVVNLQFLSSKPRDLGRAGGIFPTIIGTIILPVVALLIATPLGVFTSVYLSEYTKETTLTKVIRFGTDCLAGIPSIIFGLFGYIFFVITLQMGWSILAGSLTLAVMVLPTIIRTSEEAIRAVPKVYREVSFSLGASGWQTVKKVILPNALPGIVTGVMLSIGRSIGETAAVIFTAGSSLRIPTTAFDSVRTMAVHFYILAREGISQENAYGTAATLIIAVLIINLTAYWLMNRFIARRG